MLRTVLLSTAALALTVTTSLAAPTSSRLPNGAAVTMATRAQGTSSSYHAPIKGTVIFDSIGSGGYNCCSGWTVSGPSSVVGELIWSADQITPTVTGNVKTLVMGVGFVTGNNSAQLAIYKDASGIPGKMLWSSDASSLPTFGSTSTTTVTAKVTKVRIKANKPFWVAVQTDSNSSNTWDAWNVSNTTSLPLAQYTSTTNAWTNFGSNSAGAMTLYGKVH